MLPWVGCRGKALTRLDVRLEERSYRVGRKREEGRLLELVTGWI